jgi:hypothetical protein
MMITQGGGVGYVLYCAHKRCFVDRKRQRRERAIERERERMRESKKHNRNHRNLKKRWSLKRTQAIACVSMSSRKRNGEEKKRKGKKVF